VKTAASTLQGRSAAKLGRAPAWLAGLLLSILAVLWVGHTPELGAEPAATPSVSIQTVGSEDAAATIDFVAAATGCVLVAMCCLVGIALLRTVGRRVMSRVAWANRLTRVLNLVGPPSTKSQRSSEPSLIAFSISRT